MENGLPGHSSQGSCELLLNREKTTGHELAPQKQVRKRDFLASPSLLAVLGLALPCCHHAPSPRPSPSSFGSLLVDSIDGSLFALLLVPLCSSGRPKADSSKNDNMTIPGFLSSSWKSPRSSHSSSRASRAPESSSSSTVAAPSVVVPATNVAPVALHYHFRSSSFFSPTVKMNPLFDSVNAAAAILKGLFLCPSSHASFFASHSFTSSFILFIFQCMVL